MASTVRAAEKLGASIPSVSVPVSDVSDRIVTITAMVQVSVSVWVGSVSVLMSVMGTTIPWGRETGIGWSSRGTIWKPVIVGTGTAWRQIAIIEAGLCVVGATLPSVFI